MIPLAIETRQRLKVGSNWNDIIQELQVNTRLYNIVQESPVHTRFQNEIQETGVYTLALAGYTEEIRNILSTRSFDYVLLDVFHNCRTIFNDCLAVLTDRLNRIVVELSQLRPYKILLIRNHQSAWQRGAG